MPLDAADFIAELDINSPAGTDPLNQGDDQIRTSKRTQLNSFPLVDAAVNISAAQMNQMAIKNEENTFTQRQTFNAQIQSADGLAAAPGYSFSNDDATGMYLPAVGALGFAVAGSQRLQLGAGVALVRSNTIQAQAGADGAAAYGFELAPNTGMSRGTGGALNFAVAGVRRLSIGTAANIQKQPIEAFAGSAALPGYAFELSPGMGMTRLDSNTMIFSVGAVEKFRITNNLIFPSSTVEQIRAGFDGVAGQPLYSFNNNTNMGMYRHFSNELGLAVGGVAKQIIKGAGTSFIQQSSTGGVSLNMANSAGVTGYSWQYEGTAGFQPQQFSLSRFNRTTGAFIDIPLYINATTGRVHTALPVLSP